MNKIFLLGRFVKNPEIRYTPTGKIVCQGTIAVNRPFKQDGQQEADFIPIVIWGKSAEICGKSFKKGQRILVEGRLQVRNYDDKDGIKHYVTEVIVSNFNFIEKKAAEELEQSQNSMESFGTPIPYNQEIPF